MVPKQDLYNAASSLSTNVTRHSDMSTLVPFSWVFAALAFEMNLFKHIQTARPRISVFSRRQRLVFATNWVSTSKEERVRAPPLMSLPKQTDRARVLFLIQGRFNELVLFCTFVATLNSE